MHRRWLVLVLGGLAFVPTAWADEVGGTRSERLVERAHDALITLTQGDATMRVRRTLHNGGERHDQATIWIDVPEGAVAVGLRTRGMLGGKPHWFDGDLMEAERAARLYQELTGIGGYYPKDPALLSWRDASALALQVFPVAPGSTKQVEYTYRLPVSYSGGRYRTHVTLTAEPVPVAVTARTAHGSRLFAHGTPVTPGSAVETVGRELNLEIEPADMHELRVRLGSAPTGSQHVIHFEAQAPPRLSETPPGLHAVILIDTSRSRDESEVEASVALARAYLGHLGDRQLGARVQVIEFNHHIRARHPDFVTAADATFSLDTQPLVRSNGSDLEGALVASAEWFARAPKGAPRRLLLLSDLRVPARTSPDRARAITAPTGALIHASYVAAGEPWLMRHSDADPWSRFATESGGVLWRATAEHGTGDLAHRVFEHLVRPVRLEALRVIAPGAPVEFSSLPEELPEGEELRVDALGPNAVSQVSLHGLLWSEPVQVSASADEAEATRAAALAFGNGLYAQLSDAEMMTLAVRGRAVSPVTSYLAIEPGVRPSTEGLEHGVGGLGLSGMGAAGCGMADGRGPARDPRFDAAGFLQNELDARWRACGGKLPATLLLETTVAEIADILPGSLSDADDALRTCMMDLVWRLELPPQFARIERRVWTVQLEEY